MGCAQGSPLPTSSHLASALATTHRPPPAPQVCDPLTEGCRLGPLVSEGQYRKVLSYVEVRAQSGRGVGGLASMGFGALRDSCLAAGCNAALRSNHQGALGTVALGQKHASWPFPLPRLPSLMRPSFHTHTHPSSPPPSGGQGGGRAAAHGRRPPRRRARHRRLLAGPHGVCGREAAHAHLARGDLRAGAVRGHLQHGGGGGGGGQ